MRKSVIAILTVLLVAFGVGCYFLNKQDQKMAATRQAIAVAENTRNNSSSSPKTQSGDNSKQTPVSPSQSNRTNSGTNDPGPGTIIFPAPANSSSSGKVTGKANSGDSASSSSTSESDIPSVNVVIPNTSGLKSGSTSSSDQSSITQTSSTTPQHSPVVAAAMVSSESLTHTASGQLMLGAPSDLRTYPIIPNGTAYQGTIEPSSNLTQAELARLANYPTVSATDIGLPESMQSQLITEPVGWATADTASAQKMDTFISNLGPHIERKLQTTDWTFTPAPMYAYMVHGNPQIGSILIPGILKVRYISANNPLQLPANVWYQGDVRMGADVTFFFTNNPQDRIPRTILKSIVIVGNWGPV